MKKLIALALITVMLLFVSAALANTTLTMWCIAVEEDVISHAAYEAAVAAVEEAHSGLTIQWTAYGNEEYKTIIRNAETLPDIYFTWSGAFCGDFVAQGKAYCLEDAYADFSDDLPAVMLQNASYGTDKKPYAVPLTMNVVTLFANMDLLSRAGWNHVPKTYAELIECCDDLLSAGITPFGCAGSQTWCVSEYLEPILIKTIGYEKLSQLYAGEVSWNDPGVASAVNTFQQMIKKGYFNSDAMELSYEEVQDNFIAGQYAFYQNGSWNCGDITNAESDYHFAVATFPVIDAEKATYKQYIGGPSDSLAVSASAANPEFAAQIAFELGKEICHYSYLMGNGLPAWTPDYDTDDLNPLMNDVAAMVAEADGMVLFGDTAMSADPANFYLDNVGRVYSRKINGSGFIRRMSKGFEGEEPVEIEYPEEIAGLDFEGREVFIFDWWSSGERSENPTELEQLQYDYWDWLEETYNVKITRVSLTDWGSIYGALAEMVAEGDSSRLCIVGIPGGSAGASITDGLFMPWTYGLDMNMFDEATVNFMTKGTTCYGVSQNNKVEPRQGVFFNKRILEEAGIDWDELYDAQADGTWTWDMMEYYMDIVQEYMNDDPETNARVLTGNHDDIILGLAVSNEADYYRFDESGNLVPAIDSEEMLQAIARCQQWDADYLHPYESWDDYQRIWAAGDAAFMIGQSYEGFNSGGFVSDAGEWGFVALPKGPQAQRYTSATESNVFGVPNVYDEATALKLEQLYTLYTAAFSGVNDDSWANAYDNLTDDRAIYETYAMLRDGENSTFMKFNLIGDRNSSISEINWHMGDGTPEEIVENAMDAFQDRCDAFNEINNPQPGIVIDGHGYKEVFTANVENRYYVIPLGGHASVVFRGLTGSGEITRTVDGDLIRIDEDTLYTAGTGVSTITVRVPSEQPGEAETVYTAHVAVINTNNTLFIPDSVFILDSEAFSGVHAECVIIPDSVQLIDEGCFANCPNLRTVIWMGNPSWMSVNSAFTSTDRILFLNKRGTMPAGFNPANTGVTGFFGF